MHSSGEQRHTSLRERAILDEVRLAGGACRINFLADRLGVSEETIRRNVKSLEQSGHINKVHGGVHLIGSQAEQPLYDRMGKNSDAKRLVAAKVASYIRDGDTLFLDIGSTTAYIAKALANHKELFVVTNSVSVAHTLATRNSNRVHLAGGELRAHDGGAFGQDAIKLVRRFNVRYAILSVAAINAESGFMLHDMAEAELSREATARAQVRIMAADSAKFDLCAPVILEDPSLFDMLVTDKKPPASIRKMLSDHDVDLVLAR